MTIDDLINKIQDDVFDETKTLLEQKEFVNNTFKDYLLLQLNSLGLNIENQVSAEKLDAEELLELLVMFTPDKDEIDCNTFHSMFT